ncbi:hypothetical protein Q0590_24745 [Rhodocytophaga aerolata]|uniref:Heparin lyase I family protein n=1 Tax=Rhodocytophaga aerolata TaxID=455078 RepID=A0ABT8RBM0_9BACT|nr:hypothetical protein [Rhodocytophaga aerolata]MDO1449508.1 hypothetical protein [Rhodocytophaga aerolata]
MKQNIFRFSLPGIFLTLAISLLISCSQTNEVVAPDIALEEKAVLVPEPVLAEAPASGEVVEKTDSLVFPTQPLAAARTSGTHAIDYVDFDDELGLSLIPDYAANMFASAPFYIQQVGNAWVHVKENNNGSYSASFKSNYGHYHLDYQNFIPCTRPDGTFGRPTYVGNGCRSIDPLKQPRTLSTHYGNQWIKIYAYDYTNSSRVFDLQGIKVIHGPIRLRYRKQNGTWYEWASLGEGSWNLSSYSTGITEVLISSTNNSSISFDKVLIKMPNY